MGIIASVIAAQVKKATRSLFGTNVQVNRPPPVLPKRPAPPPYPWGVAQPPPKRPPSVVWPNPAATEAQSSETKAGREGEARVSAILDASGWRHADDLMLPKENGFAQLDHLVLCGGTLVVLETKNLAGVVQGKPADTDWVQKRPGLPDRTYWNPIEQCLLQAATARQAASTTVPIVPLVVMAGSARVEALSDSRVVRIERLDGTLRAIAAKPDSASSERARNAFGYLVDVASKVHRPTAEAWHKRNAEAAREHGQP